MSKPIFRSYKDSEVVFGLPGTHDPPGGPSKGGRAITVSLLHPLSHGRKDRLPLNQSEVPGALTLLRWLALLPSLEDVV